MVSLQHALHDGSMFTLSASGTPPTHPPISSANHKGGEIAVLCFYDHIVTFDEEVRCIWQRRISCATVLFALNRYGVLAMAAASVFNVVSVGSDYWRICSLAVPVTDTFAIIVGIAYAVFAALRIYALYDMNKHVFAAVLAIGLVSPLAQLFYACVQSIGVVRSNVSVEDLGGSAYCYQVVQTARAQEIYGTALQRALAYIVPAIRIHALIFELILIALTWRKTACRWSIQTSVFRMPFTMIFLRDGTLYFAVIAVGSLLNMLGGIIILQYSSTSPSNSTYRTMLAFLSAGPIVDVLTSICMSRFILDLVAITLDRDESGSSSPWSAVRFASVAESIVGTFGADVFDEGGIVRMCSWMRQVGDRNELDATPGCIELLQNSSLGASSLQNNHSALLRLSPLVVERLLQRLSLGRLTSPCLSTHPIAASQSTSSPLGTGDFLVRSVSATFGVLRGMTRYRVRVVLDGSKNK